MTVRTDQSFSQPNGRPQMALSTYLYPSSPTPGAVIGTLSNVPRGVTPMALPSANFTVTGSETAGYSVVVGSSVLASGPFTITLIAGTQVVRYPIIIGQTATPPAPITATSLGFIGTSSTAVPGDTFTVTGLGYDSAGASTASSRSIRVNKRLRQDYPNSASLTPDQYALSDYIRTTDTTTNFPGTFETTPVPIVAFTDDAVGKAVIGNTATAEVFVDHWDFRNGKPVACVEFIWSDGVNSPVSAKTSTLIVLGGPYDLNAVIGYRVTGVDISSLNVGTVRLDIKAYPHIGSTASIADTSSGTIGTRGFSPRNYLRNPTLLANPPYVYVDPVNGSDTTGVASLTSATASASPCLTITNAINKLVTLGGANGSAGGRLRFKAGTTSVAAGATVSATLGEVVYEADPAASPGTVLVAFGTNVNLNQQYIKWRNLKLTRTLGMFSLTTTSSGHQTFENCELDSQSQNLAFSNTPVTIMGGTCPSLNNSAVFAGTATGGVWLQRGWLVTPTNPATQTGVDGQWVFGGNYTNINFTYPGLLRSASGQVIHGVNVFDCVGSASVFILGSNNPADATCTGVSWSNFLVNWIGNNPSIVSVSVSRDPITQTSITHHLIRNGTGTGAFAAGRWNVCYDNNNDATPTGTGTNGTLRTHKFCRTVACIVPQFNTKGDYFLGTNGDGVPQPADAPRHTGNRAQLYGVGNDSNLYQWIDASGTTSMPQAWTHEFPGLNFIAPPGSNATRTNPLFIDDRSPTFTAPSTYVAGTSGGNYRPGASSPCKGVVPAGITWPFDSTGAASNLTIGHRNAA